MITKKQYVEYLVSTPKNCTCTYLAEHLEDVSHDVVNDFLRQKRFLPREVILGVFMLWFGWWGFNGGSQLRYDPSIAGIILNTNLAGAAAGLSAYLFACVEEYLLPEKFLQSGKFLQKGFVPEKVIGGVLGGLVAITASCDQASPVQAFFVIGLLAGLVHNLVFDLLLWFQIDDPVGAIPVHAGCGVLGTLLVAFTYPDILVQLRIQTRGILIAFAWTSTMAVLLCFILHWIGPLQWYQPEDTWTDGGGTAADQH
jgi:Amt family ammonium transporter